VTIEEEGEKEEANISLLFLPCTRREKGSQSMDRYFSLLYDEKKKKTRSEERAR
jgi:hypothetical protein